MTRTGSQRINKNCPREPETVSKRSETNRMNTYDAEPGKDQVDDIVHGFSQQDDLSGETMTRAHDLTYMRNGVCSSEERAVQPASPL